MNIPVTSPLLAVDVGNSRVKFGLFDIDREADGLPVLLTSLAIAPGSEPPWDQLLGWLPTEDSASVVAGSNPAGRERIVSGWPTTLAAPTVIDDPQRLGLEIRLEEPGQVGIDRLLNAVSVNRLRPVDRPTIIVDSGTATTVDAVAADGAFLGGAILPGFGLLARSLHRYTALLPMITLEDLGNMPPPPRGEGTPAAIRSGLYYGQLGAVRELVTRIGESLEPVPPELFLTGGGGPLLATGMPGARLVSHLGLRGLARVAASETGS